MVNQPVVTHSEATGMVCLGKENRGVGSLQYPIIVMPPGRIKLPLLVPTRNYGNETHIGTTSAQGQYGIGCRKIETHGHTAQKGTVAPGIEPLQGLRQTHIGFYTIVAVAGKGYCGLRIDVWLVSDHGPNIGLWRGLCNTWHKTKTLRIMKNSGIVIASLVGGMLIGSALAMLFTPQSGPELRKKIKDLVNDELDKVQDKIGEVEERIDEIRCQCEEK